MERLPEKLIEPQDVAVGDLIRCEREVRGGLIESHVGLVAKIYGSVGNYTFLTKDRGQIGKSDEDIIFFLDHVSHPLESYEVGEKFSIDDRERKETFTKHSEGWWIGESEDWRGKQELRMYSHGEIRFLWDEWYEVKREAVKARVV